MNILRLTMLLALVVPGCLDIGADPAEPTASSDAPGTRQVTIYSQELTLDSTQPDEPIPITVPDDSTAVYLDLQYGDGAYDDANFSLGGCQNVTPSSGIVVDAAGQHVSVGSTTTNNKVFPCGDVASGPQNVTWQIEAGTVKVKLLVHAAVPA